MTNKYRTRKQGDEDRIKALDRMKSLGQLDQEYPTERAALEEYRNCIHEIMGDESVDIMVSELKKEGFINDNVTNNNISNGAMQEDSTATPATTFPSLSMSQNDTAISSSNIQSNDMLVCENSTYGVSLLYPATWKNSDPVKSPEERTVFITVFEPTAESGAAYLGIARDVFNVNETLDTYLAEVIQSYRGNTLNFTLISTAMSPDLISPPQLAGNPAYSLLYSHIDLITGDMLLTEEIGTIVPGTNFTYYFYYTADIPSYNNYIDDALSIIDSLEIHPMNLNVTKSEETNIFDILEFLESGEFSLSPILLNL